MRAKLALTLIFVVSMALLAAVSCSYNEAKRVTQGGQGNEAAATTTTTTDQGGSGGETGGQGGVGGNASTSSTSGSGSGGETGGQGGTGPECDFGDQESCVTSCGSMGLRACSVYGVWSGCVPPYEACNGVDDDCNDGVDEGDVCEAECEDIANQCLWGGYGCSYDQVVTCIYDPDGLGGEPGLLFQCLCPNPNDGNKGTWLSPGTVCDDADLCW